MSLKIINTEKRYLKEGKDQWVKNTEKHNSTEDLTMDMLTISKIQRWNEIFQNIANYLSMKIFKYLVQ